MQTVASFRHDAFFPVRRFCIRCGTLGVPVLDFDVRSKQRSRALSIVVAFGLVVHFCAAQGPLAVSNNVEEARHAMARGDYESAEKLYRLAIEREPDSAALLTDLGVALQMEGRTSAAIKVFEQSLKKHYSSQTYAFLAEQRCVSRDLEGARPMVSKIMHNYADDSKIMAVVAPCLLDLDEPIESVEAYSVLLRDKAYPNDLALIQLARSYLAVAQFFVTKLRERTDGGAYLAALGQAGTSGDARSAFAAAEHASRNFDSNLEFQPALAIWRQHQDDAALQYQMAVLSGEESMRRVELCNQQYPNSAYLAQYQLEMLADQGKLDEAASGFQALLNSHPELPNLRYDLGMLYRKQGQWQMALEAFRDELSADPRDERAAARESEALDRLMRWADLRNFLSSRVQQEVVPLWATLDFAEALEQSGQSRQAIAFLSHRELEYSTSRAVHFRLLHLYRATGDMQNAAAEANWFKSQPG